MVMSKSFLKTNERLSSGESLVSSNGQFKAVFQADGNFVIYGWQAKWATDTDGTNGSRVTMQPDGNLVIYNDSNVPLWNTMTFIANEKLDCRLDLTNEGNLVLFRENVIVWSSADNKGFKRV